jgi:hypothetical protein
LAFSVGSSGASALRAVLTRGRARGCPVHRGAQRTGGGLLVEGNHFDQKKFGRVKLFLRGKNLITDTDVIIANKKKKNKGFIQETWNKYKREDINQLEYIKCLGLKYQANRLL